MNTDLLFRQADEAYDKGDFACAFALFVEASEHGDCHAMTRLASMCENGEGTPCDLAKSIEWDLKAVAAGSKSSILNLGTTYRKLGDFEEAWKWFEKAVDMGDGEAAFELAKLQHFVDGNSPLIRKYLDIAACSNDLSEDTAEEVQEWLSRFRE